MLRTVVLLVVALGVAGVTALLARDWIANQQPEVVEVPVQEEEPATRVLVASGDLPTGTLLTESHLRWQAWPDEGLSEAYVVEGDIPMEDFLGSVVRLRIAEGEPISAGRVVRPGERGFMAAVLNRGMRAVTVKINAASGVAGFAFPGDRVDVVLSHKVDFIVPSIDGEDATTQEHVAGETVLQNVRVLAIDQDTDKSGEEPVVAKTATLEVTPAQAEMVAIAAELGTLSLALRSLRGDQPTAAEDGGGLTPRPASFTPGLGSASRVVRQDEQFTRPLPLDSKRSLSHTLDHHVSAVIGAPQAAVDDRFTVLRGGEKEDERFGIDENDDNSNQPNLSGNQQSPASF